LLVQKPYFATACINCGPVAVDPSETDISKGGNAEKQEYTLLKFKYGNDYLVAATLRPETVFGQTNLWVNPDKEHVRIEVDGENWIISREAAEKIKYQKEEIILKENVDIKKCIGQEVLAPGVEKEIIVLPSAFCDPKVGTGIVTSVPSDAPYDYMALKILAEDAMLCQKYNLLQEEIKKIQPIPIIKTKGYSDYPAKDIVDSLNITSLDDPKLEEATKEVYKAGFHTGVMMDTAGKYKGKKVEEAKEMLKAELIEQGKADVLHDLSEEVICRCGSPVVIKRIDDQWFIKYSDKELTERSKEQAKEMRIFPTEYYENLPSVLDWFGDRACARLGNWLGSKFPFDNKWTIEPISDSTLYPAYYIVSKFVNNGMIRTEDLTEEFFDYVFLGKEISNKSELKDKSENKESNFGSNPESKHNWKQIKEEFDYFYPLDLNLGGKEHQTVHFPVFLMNHVAILPEEKWPQGIFVNWWVTGKGSKISKSKGGAEPIPNAIKKFGVDAMRLYYAHIGSPHIDVVWDEEVVVNYKNALERIYYLVEELNKKELPKSSLDDWLISRVYGYVKKINKSMEMYDLRELSSSAYFAIYDDLRWYLRRGGGNKKTIKEIISIWCRLINPVTPHLSEELHLLISSTTGVSPTTGSNSITGSEESTADHGLTISNQSLVSSSQWPEAEEEKISLKQEAAEELVKNTLEGMRNVIKLAKIEMPKKFKLFIAERWLYQLFNLLTKEINVTRDMGEIMKKVLEMEELAMKGKEISKIVPTVLKDVSKLPGVVTSQEEELKAMQEAKDFLEKEFSCTVEISNAEDSTETKAKSAWPGKIGILVE
ncbi:class I tRNA ligase family protein, partial [Candidatus Woesearchaeota archaeon]|nr:class I tRNA ligase family protein [Candidatus Woesearchaeota archaeon]